MFLSQYLVFKIVLAAVTGGRIAYPVASDLVLKYDSANKLFLSGGALDHVTDITLFKDGVSYELSRSLNLDVSNEQILYASDAQANDYFGNGVKISGNYAIIGSQYEDAGGSNAGAAYIFHKSGRTWTQQAKLVSIDIATNDYFGHRVDIEGDYAIVGAYNKNSNTGAAYIFKRSGTSWTEQSKLTASNAGSSDEYGRAVGISGDYAFVGARREDTGGTDRGSVYIYKRSGTTWTQQAQIQASDAQDSDSFGWALSVDGDYAIIGAYTEDTGGSNAGSAYIFYRSGTTWSQQAKIQASDKQADDRFGVSVDIKGDYAIVGADSEDTGGTDAGAAYVYKRDGTTWSQQAKLMASDAQADDKFGGYEQCVAITSDYAVVGANQEDAGGSNAGAAYVYKRDGTTWSQHAKLMASDAQADDKFGMSTAIDGNTILIGAYNESTHGANAGAAYIYGSQKVTNYYINKTGKYSADLKICGLDYKTNEVDVTSLTIPEKTIQVSAGSAQVAALTEDGSVYMWGTGSEGRLGQGSSDVGNKNTPVKVKGVGGTGFLSNIKQISCGGTQTLALANDGTLYSWGSNSEGQLGVGDTTEKYYPTVVPYTGEAISKIAAIHKHSLICTVTNGYVYACGENQSGQIGDGTSGSNRNTFTQVQGVGGSGNISGITHLSGGNDFSMILNATTGLAYGFGRGDEYQLSTGDNTSTNTTPRNVKTGGSSTNLTGITDISCGEDFSYFLVGGVVYASGEGSAGEQGDGANSDNTSATACVGTSGSGTLSGISNILGTQACGFARKSDGTLYVWGNNTAGQFASGSASSGDTHTPMEITSITGVEDIQSYGRGTHLIARKSDGSVFCWGEGTTGQIGNGVSSSVSSPTQVLPGAGPSLDGKFNLLTEPRLTFDGYNKLSLLHGLSSVSSKFVYGSNVYDIGTLTSDITIEKPGEYVTLTSDTTSNVAYFSNATVTIASTQAGYGAEQILNGFASTTVHFSSQGGFGAYIDFNGDGTRMVLGASTSFSSAQGRAYVYHLDNGTWIQKVDIPSPNTSKQRFGDSVCISEDGTRIAVNHYLDDKIYVYDYASGAWPTTPTKTINAEDMSGFGDMDMNKAGTVIIAGAGTEGSTHKAHIYTRASDTGNWSLTKTWTDSDELGSGVAINGAGTRVLIGQRDGGNVWEGNYSGGSWGSLTKVIDTSNSDWPGKIRMDSDGTTCVVNGDTSTHAGIYERGSGDFNTSSQPNLGPVVGASGNAGEMNGENWVYFSSSSSTTKLVYAQGWRNPIIDDNNGLEITISGSSFIIHCNAGNDTGNPVTVSVNGSTAASTATVSAGDTVTIYDANNTSGTFTMPTLNGPGWTLAHSVLSISSYYCRGGCAISYDGTMVLTGYNYYNPGSVASQGRAYLYQYAGGSWSLTKTYDNPKTTPVAADYWGYGTAIAKNTKDRLAIGMSGDDTAGTDYGSVHIYTNAIPDYIDFDTYNKLSLSGITNPTSKIYALPTGAESTTTYDIGTATNIYIESAGTYTAEMKGLSAFALDSNVVGTVAPNPLGNYRSVIKLDAGVQHSSFQEGTFCFWAKALDTGNTNYFSYFNSDRGFLQLTVQETYTHYASYGVINLANTTYLQGYTGTHNNSIYSQFSSPPYNDGYDPAKWNFYIVYTSSNGGTSRIYLPEFDWTATSSTQGRNHTWLRFDIDDDHVALTDVSIYTGNPGGTDSWRTTLYNGGQIGGAANESTNRVHYFRFHKDNLRDNEGTAANDISSSAAMTTSVSLPGYSADPSINFDTYNKLTFTNADTGSTYKLKYESNTYDLGTISNVYIANAGTYSAEIKGATNFALSSNVTGSLTHLLIFSPPIALPDTMTQNTQWSRPSNIYYAFVRKINTPTAVTYKAVHFWNGSSFVTPNSDYSNFQYASTDYDIQFYKSGNDTKLNVNPTGSGIDGSGEPSKFKINDTGSFETDAIVTASDVIHVYNTSDAWLMAFNMHTGLMVGQLLTFDGYNKLTLSGLESGSTSNVLFNGNTYSIGTATNVYITEQGTYDAESKGTTTFALTSNVTGAISTPPISKYGYTFSDFKTEQRGETHDSVITFEKTSECTSTVGYWNTSDLHAHSGHTCIKWDSSVTYDAANNYGWSLVSGGCQSGVTLTISSGQMKYHVPDPWNHYFDFDSGRIAILSPSLTFDGYKLVVKNITPTSTTLKYFSNTYDIGTATNIYVENTGAYTAEIGGSADFAFTSNTVSGTIKKIEPGFASRYQGSTALTYDGKLYGWGMNDDGEAGVGTSSDITVPTLCTGITQGTVAKLLSSSDLTDNSRGEVSAIKTTDGKIYMAGKGDNNCIPGKTSDQTSFTDVTSYFGDQSLTANTVTMMSFTDASGAALTETGNVWTWGTHDSTYKKLGQASASSSSTPKQINFSSATGTITKVTCGHYHTVALDSSGDVWFWGKNGINSDSWPSSVTDEPQKVVDGKNIIGLSQSYGTMYAFDATGKMWNAGNNWEGQIGDGTTTANSSGKTLTEVTYFSSKNITINKVYGGGYFVFADTSDGYYCWGNGGHGVFGNGGTGSITSGPAKWTNVTNIKKFMASTQHTTAITEDGKYYAWGRDYHGGRGDSDSSSDISYPKYINTLPNILAPSFDFDGYDKVFVNKKEILTTVFPNELEHVSSALYSNYSWRYYETTSTHIIYMMWKIDDAAFFDVPTSAIKVGLFGQSDYDTWTDEGTGHPTSVVENADGTVTLAYSGTNYSFVKPTNAFWHWKLDPIKTVKFSKNAIEYDTGKTSIITVPDSGTYDAQLKSEFNFALKSATVPATSSTGLYTWAFHHGNFDNAYGDGDILTARDNGRFYADTPAFTSASIGVITSNPNINSYTYTVSFKVINQSGTTTYDGTDGSIQFTMTEGVEYDTRTDLSTALDDAIDTALSGGGYSSHAITILGRSSYQCNHSGSIDSHTYTLGTLDQFHSRSSGSVSVLITNPYYNQTTYTFTLASALTANVMMVAGGGGGGGRYEGGGGGAGGLVYTAGTSLANGATKTIVVGNGDSGGIGSGGSEAVGFSGKNTTFTGLDNAIGGGGGGSQNEDPTTGGSGGGGNGGDGSNYNFNTGASGTSGQGTAGGDGANTLEAGGGGGAGGVGATASSGNAGDGGIGKFFGTGSSFTNFGDEYGEGGYFAGGGGGGNREENETIPGGRGGGGYGGQQAGYMAQGGSLHGMVHTGSGGGGAGTQSRDKHRDFDTTGDGGVKGHGGRGGSGIVLIQTNVAPPNGGATAVVQVGNPRRRSLPPTVDAMGSEVNRAIIIHGDSMPTYKMPTHWYWNPVGSNSNDTLNSGGGDKFFLVKRPDGITSNVFYIGEATSGELIEYGTKMAQTADAVFMPIESQNYDGFLSLGTNTNDGIHLGMNSSGVAALRTSAAATDITVGTIKCFTVGKWHHVALTVDSGGNAVGYVNGYPVVTGTHASISVPGSRTTHTLLQVGASDTFRKSLTYEVSTYNFHMSPKQVLQRAAEVGLGPKLEYDGLNAINVVNTEPNSSIKIYEQNTTDTSNLYVVACNTSSYTLSNAATYYAEIKGTDTYTITRPLTVSDDVFPLYQYPPTDGTTSSLTVATAANSFNNYWTISGATKGNGQYQVKCNTAAANNHYNAWRNNVGSTNQWQTAADPTYPITFTILLPSAKTIRKYRMFPLDHDNPNGAGTSATPGTSIDPTLPGNSGDDATKRPKSWVIRGSNNDSAWTDLDTVTNKPISIYGDVYSIDSPASYLYYQVSITANNGGNKLLLGDIQLWGDA